MVAYQLVLPVRCVRVAAAAVVAASQSFVLFDTASNTQLTRSLLAPAALGDALCAALLRPKVTICLEMSSCRMYLQHGALRVRQQS